MEFQNARISMADLNIAVQRKQPMVYLLNGSTMCHINITSNLNFQKTYITYTYVGVCVLL